ncbi:MAG TPA: hypothetical protein VEQ65_10440 [Opitutus sp.]|nr:hypothetical protein [Opitutus sp.]
MIRVLKLFIVLGLLAAAFASARAGAFNHVQDTPGVYYTNVNVPSAANCQQFGAAYGNYWHFITNNGPLGSYTRNPGNPLSVSGAIAAGNYYIFQEVYGSGYSGTVITW